MTPKELFHRICDAVDGAEVNATPRETYFAILAAGAALCGVGLRQFEEAEREQMLRALPAHARPAHQASDGEGVVWKIYPANWNPQGPPMFGFRHRNQWYQRVPERDPRTQEMKWVTKNGSVDVVMYSS